MPNLERIQFITRLLKVQLRIENKKKKKQKKDKTDESTKSNTGLFMYRGLIKKMHR